MIPQMECHIRCSDCNEPISNFPVPRGRGGVAILWPSQRDKYIKKLTDGNERIIAAEIQTKNKQFDFVPSMLQVIRSIFWILLFPSVTNEDSAVLLGGLVSLKNTSSVVLAVLI
jgi:hypothetical protein